jgi:hypothetical protein
MLVHSCGTNETENARGQARPLAHRRNIVTQRIFEIEQDGPVPEVVNTHRIGIVFAPFGFLWNGIHGVDVIKI